MSARRSLTLLSVFDRCPSVANLSASPTVLDALLASLQKATDFNRDDTMPPAAVLWPDEKRK